MPRAAPLFGSAFWGDEDVELWDVFRKLFFVYLISSPCSTLSGIYKATPKRMADESGLPLELVLHLLGVKMLDAQQLRRILLELVEDAIPKLIEHGRTKNVHYDFDAKTVYVANRFSYQISGNPQWNASGVVGDFMVTRAAKGLWRMFADRYSDKIAKSSLLTAHLGHLNEPSAPLADEMPADVFEDELGETAEPLKGDHPRKPITEEEIEISIQRELNRYAIELPRPDYERIMVLYRSISRGKFGKEYKPEPRLKMIETMRKAPAPAVARAAWLFERAAGISQSKGWPYFKAILEGDAMDWYEQLQKEAETDEG